MQGIVCGFWRQEDHSQNFSSVAFQISILILGELFKTLSLRIITCKD